MTPIVLGGALMLPAVLFTLIYFPALKLTLALVSPYSGANPRRRLCGAAVDGLLVAACGLASMSTGSVPFGIAALLYLLLRDSIGGQSIGKLVVGQVVIYVETGQRCRVGGSIKRNVMLLLPGANLAAIVLEARTLVRDAQGQRLGDRLAQTQVVEGFGARELVKELETWWTSFLSQLHTAARRPGRGRAGAGGEAS